MSAAGPDAKHPTEKDSSPSPSPDVRVHDIGLAELRSQTSLQRRLIAEIAASLERSRVLRSKGTVVVRAGLRDDQTAIVKLWYQGRATSWLRRRLGLTGPRQEARVLQRLEEGGLPVPRLLGCVEGVSEGPFGAAILMEDLGEGVNGTQHMKALIAAGDEAGLVRFDEFIFDTTEAMIRSGVADPDHSTINVHVGSDGQLHILDFEQAKVRGRSLKLPYGLMMGRLLATYTFATQPDLLRAKRFAKGLRDRVQISDAEWKVAVQRFRHMMAVQFEVKGIDSWFDPAWDSGDLT